MDEDHRPARRRGALRGPSARALYGHRRRATAVFGVGDAAVLQAEGGHRAPTLPGSRDATHTSPGVSVDRPGSVGTPPGPLRWPSDGWPAGAVQADDPLYKPVSGAKGALLLPTRCAPLERAR